MGKYKVKRRIKTKLNKNIKTKPNQIRNTLHSHSRKLVLLGKIQTFFFLFVYTAEHSLHWQLEGYAKKRIHCLGFDNQLGNKYANSFFKTVMKTNENPSTPCIKFWQNYVQNLVTIGHFWKKRICKTIIDIKSSEFHY